MMTRRVWAGLVVVVFMGCGAMTKRAPGPMKNLPPLIRDPAWIRGDCQAEMHRKGVAGLCAVVKVAQGKKLSSPAEVSRQALDQGKKQLGEQIRAALNRMINACQSACGKIPSGPPRVALLTRLTTALMGELRVADTWLAADDNLYALVALDAGAFTQAVGQDPDLDEETRRALADHARDALRP